MKRSNHATALLACALFVPAFGQQTQTRQYTISTVVGTGATGFSGDGGPAISAAINDPRGLVVDPAGNVYIADSANNRVRKIGLNGIITTIAGTGVAGFSGDGGLAVNAELNAPYRLELDNAGNLYVADTINQRVRMITPAGMIQTFAGNGSATSSGDGGPATKVGINGLNTATPDNLGNVFIGQNIGYVRKVDSTGIITTVAGNGTFGYSGDGGPATKAAFNNINGVTVDSAGNLYISDQFNNRVRKVSNGIVTTIAGNGNAGYSGDGGPATSAALNSPVGTAFDAAGNLYIADGGNNRIRVLLTNGTIMTVAGTGVAGFSGDAGLAISAEISSPKTPAVSNSGLIYIADDGNDRIRVLTPTFPVIGANGVVSASAFGGFPSVCPGMWIEIYGLNLATSTRPWASADFNGNNAPTSLNGTTVTVGGKLAFIDYISPFQVNALITSDTPPGLQQLIVQNGLGVAYSYTVLVNPMEPGFLAPPSFSVNGTPYIVALFQDGFYALPTGAIAGVNSRLAKPGDVLTLYGVGFGPVTPSLSAGQIVQQLNTLAGNFQLFIGGVAVTPSYDGLAPDFTGLYQFNIVVPSVPAGNQPLTFNLGGAAGTQTLNIAIGN